MTHIDENNNRKTGSRIRSERKRCYSPDVDVVIDLTKDSNEENCENEPKLRQKRRRLNRSAVIKEPEPISIHEPIIINFFFLVHTKKNKKERNYSIESTESKDSDNCFLNKYEQVILQLSKVDDISKQDTTLKVRKLEHVCGTGKNKMTKRIYPEWSQMAKQHIHTKETENLHTDKVPEDLSLFHVWINVNDLFYAFGNRFHKRTLRNYKDVFISDLQKNFIKHKGLTHSFCKKKKNKQTNKQTIFYKFKFICLVCNEKKKNSIKINC
ncbi:hypothetical protein RFI_37116 [Reticulomyxa filosa]|uniref:Uncharacterized protein n=1 Tax=Reticulomyxa filosa TaxID=46433 RepID=X6LFJ4_RETFI|nr:hypothetical protein RFI_37116 [Reticulomyxa filosa]|eukprot:ETO00334.1 hypothetical protein RFI_37116 [Reticulomyxa filosa]